MASARTPITERGGAPSHEQHGEGAVRCHGLFSKSSPVPRHPINCERAPERTAAGPSTPLGDTGCPPCVAPEPSPDTRARTLSPLVTEEQQRRGAITHEVHPSTPIFPPPPAASQSILGKDMVTGPSKPAAEVDVSPGRMDVSMYTVGRGHPEQRSMNSEPTSETRQVPKKPLFSGSERGQPGAGGAPETAEMSATVESASLVSDAPQQATPPPAEPITDTHECLSVNADTPQGAGGNRRKSPRGYSVPGPIHVEYDDPKWGCRDRWHYWRGEA